MTEKNGLRGTVDHIKIQKFKKTEGYESKLDKLYKKALKAKPGKMNIEVESVNKSMNFKSLGTKPSPVNSIDYEKIKSLKKSSPSDRVVAFAYPGPNEKSPILMHTMRFKEELAYNSFTQKMEGSVQSPPPLRLQSPQRSERPTSERPAGPTTPPTAERTENIKTPPPSNRYSSSSSSSSLSSSNYRLKTPRHHSSKPNRCVQSYISTDGLYQPFHRRARSKSPIIRIHSPYQTTYITTTSRFHTSPPQSRASSARQRRSRSSRPPQRQVKVCTIYKMSRNARSGGSYSSSSDESSSTMTESSNSSAYSRGSFRLRPRVNYTSSSRSSSLSSSGSSSDEGPELFGTSIPESRSFVISRCTRDGHSTMRCRPVGGITVTSETPSFTYEA
ncbi:expressed conserved protein [Echinococcus multilocularis]|uniref:Expressed conserved protein n=1 Tax=Echinococcus multilocularis TaxID=6211 RepID=A0A068Y9S8_ECHMU|nr:expressed conserved protein [Echinococcus multilocularis]